MPLISAFLLLVAMAFQAAQAQPVPAKRKPIAAPTVPAQPARPAMEAMPSVPLTEVFDQTGDLTIALSQPVMSSSQHEPLREQLARFKQTHSEPMAVLLMPALNQGWERMEDYAPKIARKWAVGQADAGTGLLVIVAFGQRGTQAALSFAPSLFARLTAPIRQKMHQDFLSDLRAAELAEGLSKLIATLNAQLAAPPASPAAPDKP